MADDIIGAQILDESEAAIATAKADIAAAKATIQSVEVELAYTTVAAPIAGRVGKVLATKGNVVQGGGQGLGTHLLTLVYDQTIDVAFDISENKYLKYAGRLQAAVAGKAELPIDVHLDGHEQALAAKLHMIDNQAAVGSGVVRLYARLDNPAGQLIPGVFARIQLQLEDERPVLLVHEAAVMAQLNMRYVYSVGEGGVTAFTPVQLGERIGDLRVVESGLNGEEQIAVTNLKKIFYPGMPVQPIPGDMATATSLAMPAPDTPQQASASPDPVSDIATDIQAAASPEVTSRAITSYFHLAADFGHRGLLGHHAAGCGIDVQFAHR